MTATLEISNSSDTELTVQGKVISLFQFIREMNLLKQRAILNVGEYRWFLSLSDLPDDPAHISVFFRDRVENEDGVIGNTLLAVNKPEFQSCPHPAPVFVEWLEPGWDDYHNDGNVKETLLPAQTEAVEDVAKSEEVPDTDSPEDLEPVEFFSDDAERVSAYQHWAADRKVWVEKQKIAEKTRSLFSTLYGLYYELQKESETLEIVAANGLLLDRDNPNLRHPVLTHRVSLRYDADKNIVSIEDTAVPSELYSILFQIMDVVNLSAINAMSDDLQKNDYHPLDRNDTPGFLKSLVHQLSSDSMFDGIGITDGWQKSARLLLSVSPCYIVRKRLDGTPKAIDAIIAAIQKTGYIPEPIGDLVSGGKIAVPDESRAETVEEQLAAVGGESAEILLSKEANREQLEIARRIESYNAVLVQGPPGTGKTHTIANLMGHFLAQGKSVLVTSHTKKALRVLKEKVAPGLQSLCVSILDDSNLDMERSVDGITSYMSKTTSHELEREMDTLAAERKQIIQSLADTRRRLYALIHQECDCIVWNGESFSPSKAAEFVLENADMLSYIPGKVRLNTTLPLTFAQLADLYRSNEGITAEDEQELACDIPAPEQLLSPDAFKRVWDSRKTALRRLRMLEENTGWKISPSNEGTQVRFGCPFGDFTVENPNRDLLNNLKQYAVSFGRIEDWMKCAAVDGKNGGAYKQRWMTLIGQIQQTCSYAESVVAEQFGNNIRFVSSAPKAALAAPIEKLKGIFAAKGKVNKLILMRHKDCAAALEAVSINDRPLQSASDCDVILHSIELDRLREQCAVYWDTLLSAHGAPGFMELDSLDPERVAMNWLPLIQKYLDWEAQGFRSLLEYLNACKLPAAPIFSISTLDSDTVRADKIFSAIESTIPLLCTACNTALEIADCTTVLRSLMETLAFGKRSGSKTCSALRKAADAGNPDGYSEAYYALSRSYAKYELQRKRGEMLQAVESVAPQWADAIRNRDGIHGAFSVPETIEDAWKWKQLSGIIDEITAQPFQTLQEENLRLSREYRRITAQYAEKSGWYHLLKNTESDLDMKMALMGWKLTVKRIGKGTGKNAPALKETARKLMAKCQNAVPGWIMPMNRALESMNPAQNRFDVVIVDEASQSDISALAILYMGRKLIVVGDDKQVSPMAVGIEVGKMNALEEMYLKDKIPNSPLYTANTSIYDIASTVFQPLMLLEHFRCVPEIIGFSNMLSYDYRIKPLRDAGTSNLLPAVVNYRVAEGIRDDHRKINLKEAETILALIKACMEQPEYAGKTIGVISLLGDEQVQLLQRMIEEQLDPKEVMTRQILCGNSANFQGDERDVIFLSMVDSGRSSGPLSLMSPENRDSGKRYNVAASRAKDQLWVVHSLDAANDLKPGDIRKRLLDYAADPQAYEQKLNEITQKSESPFETAVAAALTSRGYHLAQQWKVGSYRIDMVAICGKRMVAIECDGERFHTGEAFIRADMERQTILERLGWRFIRIRGSEYFRHPEGTINHVVSSLQELEIEPEDSAARSEGSRSSALLERVKNQAGNILLGESDESVESIPTAVDETLKAENGILDISTPLQIPGEIGGIPDELPLLQKAAEASQKSALATAAVPEPIDRKPTTYTVKVKKRGSKPDFPEQIMLDGMSDAESEQKDVIAFLNDHHISFIDKRSSGGSLWALGGHELDAIMREAKEQGYVFRFKAEGGKATKGKPGWWFK